MMYDCQHVTQEFTAVTRQIIDAQSIKTNILMRCFSFKMLPWLTSSMFVCVFMCRKHVFPPWRVTHTLAHQWRIVHQPVNLFAVIVLYMIPSCEVAARFTFIDVLTFCLCVRERQFLYLLHFILTCTVNQQFTGNGNLWLLSYCIVLKSIG